MSRLAKRLDQAAAQAGDPVARCTYTDARDPQVLTDVVGSLLAGERLFLSGGAGTGKTTLVRKIAEAVGRRHEEIVLTASTGLAACQLRDETGLHNSRYVKGPTTLHSAAFLPIVEMPDPSRRISKGRRKLEKASVVVVDEISMVDRVTFDRFLNRVSPGTGLLVVGDFFQLPPVLKNEEGKPDFAFDSPPFAAFKLIDLQVVLRQAEPEFIEFLKSLRNGRVEEAVLARAVDDFDPNYPVLFGTNRQADAYNRRCIDAIGARSTYSVCCVKIGETEPVIKWLETYTRAKARLEFKRGMRVLCIQNHEGLVNGDLGTITDISGESEGGTELPRWVEVRFDRQSVGLVRVCPFEFQERVWDASKKEEAIKYAVVQYPLVPAYGLTVHKSQGMTLDVVNVDGSRVNFVPGHVYVALSRARTFNGIRLRNAHGLSAFHDPAVVQYYARARRYDGPASSNVQAQALQE
ncbi:MAG: AAA family ATPase [Sedimentisphaerales bacterium]|nr:AAA family ATPase [Sedimentisphaerales bacterium]